MCVCVVLQFVVRYIYRDIGICLTTCVLKRKEKKTLYYSPAVL